MKSPTMRTSLPKGHRKRQAMYLIPNLCTTGNLFCGVFAILSVFNGQHLAAAIAILAPNKHIAEKLHLNLFEPRASATFAPTLRRIKAERTGR